MKYAYINGKILDGTKDMQVKEGFVILTDNDKIEDIVKAGTDLNGYEKVDLKRRYIMPGLINMHVHLAGNGKPQKKQRDNEKLVKILMGNALMRSIAYGMVAGFAKTELMSGVTTIRTVGGLGSFDTKLRDEINAGTKMGPRILAANEGISVPGGHMAGSVAVAADSIDTALKHLEQSEKEKVDLIKLMITGGLGSFDTKLRDEINVGTKIGPRILAANEGISVPGGHMAGSVAVAADSIDTALKHLEQSEKEKVDLIKLMITGGVMDAKEKGVPGELKMSPEMVKVVCDKAHENGYLVAAHVESPQGVRVALENGVDSIEHGAKIDDDTIKLFKERKAFLCTTISPALPYALFDRSITNATEVEQFNGNVVFEGIIACAKAALENDIPVVLGNDVGCPWITQYDFWRELYYFHKYTGVSNAFALYTATARAAEMAGIGDITGTLEKDKCADMIVTEENPLDDLRALRHVKMVVARGTIMENPKVKINKRVETELDKFL